MCWSLLVLSQAHIIRVGYTIEQYLWLLIVRLVMLTVCWSRRVLGSWSRWWVVMIEDLWCCRWYHDEYFCCCLKWTVCWLDCVTCIGIGLGVTDVSVFLCVFITTLTMIIYILVYSHISDSQLPTVHSLDTYKVAHTLTHMWQCYMFIQLSWKCNLIFRNVFSSVCLDINNIFFCVLCPNNLIDDEWIRKITFYSMDCLDFMKW